MENKSIEELEEELKRLKLENELRAEIDRQNRLSVVHSGRSNIINEFFWWCAGVDKDLIRQCPTDYAKYVGIGGTILFTALMAMLSGAYAISSVFNDTVLNLPFGLGAMGCNKIGLCFGLFWGALIFNLDRFMVNTMFSDGTAAITKEEWKSGAPRIILAVFLGFVISTPIELKIFDDKIQAQLLIDQGIAEQKIDEVHENLQPMIDKLESRKDSIDRRVIDIERLVKDAEDKLYAETNGTGLTQTIGYGPAAKQLQQNVDRLRENEKTIKAQAKEDKNNIDARIAALREKQDSYKNDRGIATKSMSGFTAKLDALSEVTSPSNNMSLFLARLAIMFLFIAIEVIPTIFKMMMTAGPYDEKKHELEDLIHAQVVRNTSQMNDDVNTDLLISTEKNKKRLEAEITANSDIMERIALTQAELLKTSIELWRQEELKKIQENPKSYIVTNEG